MRRRVRIAATVALGGLVVATLEAVDAVIAYGLLRDVPPIRIFQGVAAGVLGRSAFQGGWPTALLGGIVHYAIASTVVAAYVLAARRWPALARRPVAWGAAYGAGVYVVMTFAVVPASALASRGPDLPLLLNGVIGHALLVGLPAALFARAALSPRKASGAAAAPEAPRAARGAAFAPPE